jgi:hypothetical protein
VPGGQGSSPIIHWPDAHARLASIACDQMTRASARPLLALGRRRRVCYALSGVTLADASPSSSSKGSITTIFACASASCTRDRPASSNQSPSSKHYERDPLIISHDRSDHRSLDTPCGTCSCPVMRVGLGISVGPPLLRFWSPATLTGCARAVRGGRPPDDPASAFHPRRPARSQCDLPTR